VEETSDEQLMRRYKSGEMAAFDMLYARYAGRLFGYLKRRVPGAADEIFQNVFMKLHENRDRYLDGQKFSPWFFTIARNAMIDFLRRQKAMQGSREFDENRHGAQDKTAEEESSNEHAAGIELILHGLSEDERDLLNKRFDQELSYEEIAESLSLSSVVLRKRVSRLITKIRRLLP